jgi:histidinol-phosphate aminotransferase
MTEAKTNRAEAPRAGPARDPLDAVRPAVRGLTAYHLDAYQVPVKLNQNENAYPLPPAVREELNRRIEYAPLHRYPVLGAPELRAALSQTFDWPAEGILVGNGSDELLHMIALTFLEAGRTAVSPVPSFSVYETVTYLVGAELVRVPLVDLEYDVSAIDAAVRRHQPHVLYLCSPNNPTGSVLEMSSIGALTRSAPGIVVLDEAYWEFAVENARELMDAHPNLVILRTFSKAIGLAGARIGFLMAHPALASEIKKTQQPYVLNRLSEHAGLAALNHYDWLRERAREIVAERKRVFDALKRLDGVEVFSSESNFLLIRTRLGAQRTFDGLRDEGVLVRDVSGYPDMEGILRVTVGTFEENAEFLRALECVLEKNERGTE